VDNQHGNVGNKYAERPADEIKLSQVQFRCRPEEKGKWVAAANRHGMTLSEFMTRAANDLTDRLLTPD
jgi:uncharacterized protein (DUF1778 family)